MSDLLQAVKNLRELHFRTPRQLESFSLTEIEKLRAELEKKIESPTLISSVDLEKLIAMWINGERNFMRRDLKRLPFIMFDRRLGLNDAEEILKLTDWSRETHLKNIVAVYLSNFDESDRSILLRRKLSIVFKSSTVERYRSKMLARISSEGSFMFDDDCMEKMSALYLRSASIDEAVSAIGLTEFFKGSQFILRSLKYFLCTSSIDIRERLIILYEIASGANNIYEGVIRSTADVVIPDVEAIKNPSEVSEARRRCLEIFYRALGDPRFGSLKYRWDDISQRAKEIFLHWLAESDLDLFFKIIEQTAVDRMWRYRKDFWKSYLPHIGNTWVFLGRDAQFIAKHSGDKVLNHGKLDGGSHDQSVLVFQIGEYIFVEWSHSGKLRVYYRGEASNWFGARTISRWDITYSHCIAEWIHSNPANYTWQRNVSNWIAVNCGL